MGSVKTTGVSDLLTCLAEGNNTRVKIGIFWNNQKYKEKDRKKESKDL